METPASGCISSTSDRLASVPADLLVYANRRSSRLADDTEQRSVVVALFRLLTPVDRRTHEGRLCGIIAHHGTEDPMEAHTPTPAGPQALPPAAGSTPRRKRARGRIWHITIVTIPVSKYPQFMNDPDHPCQNLSEEARLKDFDACLATLWARACLERRSPTPSSRQVP